MLRPAVSETRQDRTAALEAMIENVTRRERSVRSQISMPACEADARVSPHVLDPYACFPAADGKPGPGKPSQLAQTKRSLPVNRPAQSR